MDSDVLEVELKENTEPVEEIRKYLQEIFDKYGYTYDPSKFGELDDDLVRYVNLDYADYVLSKFKQYDISNDEIYVRKRVLYRILVDRDQEVFDSSLKFVDSEQCTLSMLLSMPSIFVRR
jgi:hypothetical protein